MRILIGGGGTGGHIYPALALARHAIKTEETSTVLFVGSTGGLENIIVPQAGFELVSFPVSGFKRSLKGFIPFLKDLFSALKAARRLVSEFKPSVVLGTGGYVSFPLAFAALSKRRPVVIHEQNALPGMANRFLAPLVKRVCVSFPETNKQFPPFSRVVYTGNPRSSDLKVVDRKLSCRELGLNHELRYLLAYGGSRGALRINEVFTEYLKKGSFPDNVGVLYITGDIYYEEVLKKIGEIPDRVKIYPYMHQMEHALAVANLILSRSGATTLAELTVLGIPAILIPSPNVVANHQYFNARILADAGAAVLIEEKEFSTAGLTSEVNRLFSDPALLNRMSAAGRKIGMPDAAERLYRILEEVAS